MKTALCIALVMLGVSVAGAADAPQDSNGVFDVKIALDGIKSQNYKMNGAFFVKTKIKNISKASQKIVIWTQQGWSWVSDKETIVPDISTLGNYPHEITLPPGKEFSGKVAVSAGAWNTGATTFKLGFTPHPETAASTSPDFENSGGLFWSNAVTLPAR